MMRVRTQSSIVVITCKCQWIPVCSECGLVGVGGRPLDPRFSFEKPNRGLVPAPF